MSFFSFLFLTRNSLPRLGWFHSETLRSGDDAMRKERSKKKERGGEESYCYAIVVDHHASFFLASSWPLPSSWPPNTLLWISAKSFLPQCNALMSGLVHRHHFSHSHHLAIGIDYVRVTSYNIRHTYIRCTRRPVLLLSIFDLFLLGFLSDMIPNVIISSSLVVPLHVASQAQILYSVPDFPWYSTYSSRISLEFDKTRGLSRL